MGQSRRGAPPMTSARSPAPEERAQNCSRCGEHPRLPWQRWCRRCLTGAQRLRRATEREALARRIAAVIQARRIGAFASPNLGAVTQGSPVPSHYPSGQALTATPGSRLLAHTGRPTPSTTLAGPFQHPGRYTATVGGDFRACEFCGRPFRPERRGQRFGCNCCGSSKPHLPWCAGHDPAPPAGNR